MAISFATAPVLAKPAKKKRDDRIEVAIKRLEDLAAVQATIKSLKAMEETMMDDVKDQITEWFLTNGCATQEQPDNFRGIDGDATASCELRKRSSASALSDDEQAILAEHNIPMETATEVEETFVINPAYLTDSKLMEKVAKALNGVKGIPDDFIMQQPGRKKVIIGEAAVGAAFKKPINIARKLLSIVAVPAVKTTISGIMAAKVTKKLIANDDETAEMPVAA